MKNYWSYLKNIRKRKLLLFAILILFFVYFLIGIFPITRFETDSMAIANACEEMMQAGHFQENVLGHSYHMQSGTYFLIITLAKSFGLSAFVSYSILTIIFAFIYWIFLALILKKITNTNWLLIIIILFLFQEIFILSYYANSAVIASAFWIISFYLLWISDNKYIVFLAALLLSLAAWFRIDVAFTFPSVFLLLYIKNKNLKAAIIKSVVLAIIVIPVTLLLMYLMNATITGFLGYTQNHGVLFSTEQNIGFLDLFIVKAHAAYFSIVLLFLITFSLIILFKSKNYKIILFLISGILFYYLLGINSPTAPKHLSYFTFFWCLIILIGLNSFNEFKSPKKTILIYFILFLFIIQYLIGVRIDIKSVPYQFDKCSTLNPFPTVVSLGNIKLNKSSFINAEFVIGAGTKISTPDEQSASSGILFSPLMWYKQKEGLFDSFNKLTQILNNSKDDTLFIIVADGSQFAINNLLTNGFRWKEKIIDMNSEPNRLTFIKNGSPVIKLIRYTLNKSNFKDFLKSFQNMKKNNYYFVFIWDWQNYYTEKMNLPFIEKITYQIHKLK